MEVVTEETMETEESIEDEWAPEPNEPRYCLCNQVSYGDMVACDNPDVRMICYLIITIRRSSIRLLLFDSAH
jgi:hypothetical protein